MVEKFTVPKTEQEFLERVGPVTKPGARAVIVGLEQKLRKVADPIKAEIQFFQEAIEYKESGKLPERFNND